MNNIIPYQLEASVFPWEIAPGKTIEAWGYNNRVPGPVLHARKGDTLVVVLKNNLPEPTTIHWHGVRLPSDMDGTEEVQPVVMPGKTFEYRFEVPDAGTFWFHPHTNETVQMERGLYGTLVVSENNDPVFDNERVLMIDDMKLDSQNRFSRPSWFLPRWLERHNGREGNTLLVNGKEMPQIQMAGGQTERWRIVNASSARYFRFYLEGRPFRIIGTDGGLLEKPYQTTEVLITPGERMDIAIGPFKEGETIRMESLPFNRGTGKGKKNLFASISIGPATASSAQLPEKMRAIEPLALPGAKANKTIKLFGVRNWCHGVDFTINDQINLHDEPVRTGELQVWQIDNPGKLDHPFHLHGFFFQVIEDNGRAPAFMAWKDTYNVRRKGSIKIAWMPDNRIGMWMYHCHILEHAVSGMMAHFEVTNGQHPAFTSKKSPHNKHHAH